MKSKHHMSTVKDTVGDRSDLAKMYNGDISARKLVYIDNEAFDRGP